MTDVYITTSATTALIHTNASPAVATTTATIVDWSPTMGDG